MPAEYQRQQERPEIANRARLAQAARVILKDIPAQAADFGWAAGVLKDTPNEDAAILQMIDFGRRLQEYGEDMVFGEIEKQSGMRVDILDPSAKWDYKRNRNGFLVSLEGTGVEDITGLQMPFIKGRVVVRDHHGIDSFLSIGIVENGTVFALPEKPKE